MFCWVLFLCKGILFQGKTIHVNERTPASSVYIRYPHAQYHALILSTDYVQRVTQYRSNLAVTIILKHGSRRALGVSSSHISAGFITYCVVITHVVKFDHLSAHLHRHLAFLFSLWLDLLFGKGFIS